MFDHFTPRVGMNILAKDTYLAPVVRPGAVLVVPEHAHRVGDVLRPEVAQRDADAVGLAEELLVSAHRQARRDDVAVQYEGAPREVVVVGAAVPPDVLLGLAQDLVEAVVGEEDGPPDAAVVAVGEDHDAVGEVAKDARELQARDRKGP